MQHLYKCGRGHLLRIPFGIYWSNDIVILSSWNQQLGFRGSCLRLPYILYSLFLQLTIFMMFMMFDDLRCWPKEHRSVLVAALRLRWNVLMATRSRPSVHGRKTIASSTETGRLTFGSWSFYMHGTLKYGLILVSRRYRYVKIILNHMKSGHEVVVA